MQKKSNVFQKEASYQKAFFWNMMGSSLNAISSVVMLLITTRICGEIQGGIFSIGFAIASLMWSIASYETNTFHVTDGKKEFRNEDFLQVKLLLCLLVLIISIIYISFKGYEVYKGVVAFLLCLYKILDAFSGFFYGMFQKAHRLDIAGKSYFCRVLFSLTGFCLILFLGGDLAWAVSTACIIEVLWIGGYEISLGKQLLHYRSQVHWGKIKDILIKCFPLFSASFILMYINNLPKYTIDLLLNEKIQNVFGIIFMPASMINLIGIFIFRPLLTTLVRYWNEGKMNDMLKLCMRCFLIVTGVTIVCVIGAYVAGIPILQWLYGVELSNYKTALVIIMLAGGINACISFLYNILVVARKQIWILVAYLPALLLAFEISKPLIVKYQIIGASLLYLISLVMIFIILVVLVMMIVMRKRKQVNIGE